MPRETKTLTQELSLLLNRYSADGHANTPDYILANFLFKCLNAFISAVDQRDAHEGKIFEQQNKNK